MLKRGIVFTLDVIVASVTALYLLLTAAFYLSEGGFEASPHDRYVLALDSLAVLESDGTLANTIRTGNTIPVRDFIAGLPSNFCADVTLLDAAGNALYHERKNGCQVTNETSIVRRVFLHEYEPYMARLEAWYE